MAQNKKHWPVRQPLAFGFSPDDLFRWDSSANGGEPGKGDPAKVDAAPKPDEKISALEASLAAERSAREAMAARLAEFEKKLATPPEKKEEPAKDPILAQLEEMNKKFAEISEKQQKAEQRAGRERLRSALIGRAREREMPFNTESLVGEEEGSVFRPSAAGIKLDESGKVVGEIDKVLDGWRKDSPWAFATASPKGDSNGDSEYVERNPGTGKNFHPPGSERGNELRKRAMERTMDSMGRKPDGTLKAGHGVPVYQRSPMN